MRHIKKVPYIRLEIDRRTFNQIHEQRLLEINLEDNDFWKSKLAEANEFIRFTYETWYMDLTIRKIVPRNGFVIHLGKVIDYNKPHIK